MFGHGTGTLSILAGKDVDGKSFGAAGNLDIVPVRVANWVVLFRNSAIARAFDYVHSLCDAEETRIHVVTMSMDEADSPESQSPRRCPIISASQRGDCA